MTLTHSDAPGTVRLFTETGERLHTEVQLVPRPSSDPEDPLNWTRFRKSLSLFCILFYTFSMSILATNLGPLLVEYSISTSLTIDQLVAGMGYSYWAIGFSSVIFQPMSLAIGKRPVIVISALAGGLINMWTVYITDNGSWIAQRFLLGLASGPSFALAEVVIADVFFYHQRGLPLGLYIFALYFGALFAPMLAGFIFDGMGTYKAVVWLVTGLELLTAVILFFLFEETNYTRDEPSLPETAVVEPETTESLDEKDVDKTANATYATTTTVTQSMPDPIVSTWKGPKFWKFLTISPVARGIMLRGLVQPFALMRLPIVIWCGVMYGIYQVYFNLISGLTAGIFAVAPYGYSTSKIGLTYLGPMFGTIPGAIFGGILANKFTVYRARRNHGISEPEDKLWLFVFPGVLCPIGLLMTGLGPYYGAHWSVYVIGESLTNLGGPLATLLVLAYAFDAFHTIDPEDNSPVKVAAQDNAPYIIAIIFIGMSLTFAMGYAITPWSFGWSFKWFGITAALSSRSGEAYYRRVINW